MRSNKLIRIWVTGLILVSIFYSGTMPVFAQDDGGFSETFDDPTLPGWEHSQDVLVSEGVLQINPGNFAFRFAEVQVQNLSVKFKITPPAEVFFHYQATDTGVYNLIIVEERAILEKVQKELPSELGSSPIKIAGGEWNNLEIKVNENQFQIYLNNELLFTAADESPLPPGGVGMEVHGENPAEFDDLVVQGSGVVAGPAGVEEQPEGEAPQPQAENAQLPASQTPAAAAGTTDSQTWVEELFTRQANPLEMQAFLLNLGLAALLSFILSRVYIHWGSSLTNRRKFAANFMLMTLTTTFIILVVRSSVALSLGLVGALSIVRFRAAVKEPEELAYLFLAIGLGIGLGDNQRLITILAFAVSVALLGLMKLLRQPQADVNLHLNILSHNPQKLDMDQVMKTLKPFCTKIKLMRFDENEEVLEMAFLVELRQVTDLNAARKALHELSEKLEISFLDNKGVW